MKNRTKLEKKNRERRWVDKVDKEERGKTVVMMMMMMMMMIMMMMIMMMRGES